MKAPMKRFLLPPALILLSLTPACGEASAPPAQAETPAAKKKAAPKKKAAQ